MCVCKRDREMQKLLHSRYLAQKKHMKNKYLKPHRYSRIPIMRCSYNSVGPWAPVYPRNNLVMLFQDKMEKLLRHY